MTPTDVKRTLPLAKAPAASVVGGVETAGGPAIESAARKVVARPGIAVLPLANMSADAAIDHLSDGICEDLITQLSSNRHVSVASRTSTFAFKDQSKDIRAIGETLGARYVVEGSVRKVGQDARVTIQLIEATSGAHVWAKKFDEPLDAILASSDDLVERIAASLFAQLMWAEADRSMHAPPESLGAWEYCQRVNARVSRAAGSVKTIRLSISEMEKALEIEPDSGIAHALLSWGCNAAIINGLYEDDELQTYVARAKHHLKRARELAQDDQLCLTWIGGSENFAGMHDRALQTLERVIARNPANSEAWYILCQVYAYLGRFDEARGAIERADALAPEAGFSPIHDWYRGLAEFLAGDYQTAAPSLKGKALKSPDYGYVNILCALCEESFGRHDTAQKYIAKAKEHNPQLAPHKIAGMILTQHDKAKGAREFALIEKLWAEGAG